MSRPIVVIVCIVAPLNGGSLNSTRIHGTHVPVEEPSTASTTDSCTAANSVIRSLDQARLFLLIWLKLTFSESDVAGYSETGQVTSERRRKPFQLARGAMGWGTPKANLTTEFDECHSGPAG